MSFGRLCEHCKQGRVRPFQFNWKQAVVTCDNADCELRLDVSPWDCIVDHPLRSRTHHSSSKGSSFVGSQSSSSSSGIQSDLRSPVLSPFTSPSYESVTDKEVENLLKRTLGPEYLKKSHSPETKNTLPECPEVLLDSEQQNQSQTQGNDTFDSFFELLNNLDSEFPSTSVKGDYVSFNQKNVNEENIFESVTSELESLMNSIESPSKIIKDDLQEENAVVKQEVQCIDFDKKIKNHSLVDNRVYIPSKSSAFSEVSPKKDIVADYSFACSLSDTLLTEPCDNLVPGFEKVDNIARTDLSICDAQFLSPATSAVSDDSGYEDNAVRVNSVFPPPLSQVECGRDSSSKVSLVVRENGGERQAQTLQNSQKVLKLSEMVASPQAKEAAPNVPPVSSHVEHAATIIDETDKMEIEDKGGHSSSSYPPIEGDSNCSCSFVPNDRVLSEDCFQKSSQLSSYVASPSSLNIQPIAENHLADSPNLASSECAHTSEGPSEISNDASLNDEEDSTQTTNICTEEVRHQKKRGRPRGSWSRPTQRVGVKRKQRVTKTKLTMVEEEKVNSLKKGLNQLLQTPSLQFRRDENGNQNITTLGLRNRLNGNFVEDPWSLLELYLEEVCIEVVVQDLKATSVSSQSQVGVPEDKTDSAQSVNKPNGKKLEEEKMEKTKNSPLQDMTSTGVKQSELLKHRGKNRGKSKDVNGSLRGCKSNVNNCALDVSRKPALPQVRENTEVSDILSESVNNGDEDSLKLLAQDWDEAVSDNGDRFSDDCVKQPLLLSKNSKGPLFDRSSFDLTQEKQIIKGTLEENSSENFCGFISCGSYFANLLQDSKTKHCENDEMTIPSSVDSTKMSVPLSVDLSGLRAGTSRQVQALKKVMDSDSFQEESRELSKAEMERKISSKDCMQNTGKILGCHAKNISNNIRNISVSADPSVNGFQSYFESFPGNNDIDLPSLSSVDASVSCNNIGDVEDGSSCKLLRTDSKCKQDVHLTYIKDVKHLSKVVGLPHSPQEDSEGEMFSLSSKAKVRNDVPSLDYNDSTGHNFSSEYVNFDEDTLQCPTLEGQIGTVNDHGSNLTIVGQTILSLRNSTCPVSSPANSTFHSEFPSRSSVVLDENRTVTMHSTSSDTVVLPEAPLMFKGRSYFSKKDSREPSLNLDIKSSLPIEVTENCQSLCNLDIKSKIHENCDKYSFKCDKERAMSLSYAKEYEAVFGSPPSPVTGNRKEFCEICKCSSRGLDECHHVNIKRELEESEMLTSSCRNDGGLTLASDTSKENIFKINSIRDTSQKSRELPLVSIDSDDEIQILMPVKKEPFGEDSSCRIREGWSLTNIKQEPCTVDDILKKAEKVANDHTLGHSQVKEEPCLFDSIVEAAENVVQDHKLGSSKVESNHTINKRINMESSIDAPSSKRRKTGNRKFCLTENNLDSKTGKICHREVETMLPCKDLMCGIMDYSVVHNSNCYSPRSNGFIEFEDNINVDSPPKSLKFYFGSESTDFKLQNDLQIKHNIPSVDAMDNVHDITLKGPQIPSNYSCTFSFDAGKNYGCPKSSPQYDLSALDESDVDPLSLSSKDMRFLCFETSSESSSSSEDEEYSKSTKADATDERKMVGQTDCSDSNPPLAAGSVEAGMNIFDVSAGVKHYDLNIQSRLTKKTEKEVMHDREVVGDCKDNIIVNPVTNKSILSTTAGNKLTLTFKAIHPHCADTSQSSQVPIVPMPKRIIPSVCKSLSSPVRGKSLSHSSSSSFADVSRMNHARKIEDENILKEKIGVQEKSFAMSKLPQTHDPSHLSGLKPSDNCGLISSFHHFNSQYNFSSQPSSPSLRNYEAEHSSVEHGPYSMQQKLSSSSAGIKLSSVTVRNPSQEVSNIIFPASSLATHPSAKVPQTAIFNIANPVNSKNMQEKIVVVKTQTPNGTVMKLLRVNVNSNQQHVNVSGNVADSSSIGNVPASVATSSSCRKNYSISANESKNSSNESGKDVKTAGKPVIVVSKGNISKFPATSCKDKVMYKNISHVMKETGSIPSIYSNSDSPSHLCPNKLQSTLHASDKSDLCQRSSVNLLNRTETEVVEKKDSSGSFKTINIGNKGMFYIRPPPAIIRAISKEKKIETETEKDDICMELPDGIPISHPIFISRPKKEKDLSREAKKEKESKEEEKRKSRHKLRLIKALKKRRVKAMVDRAVQDSVIRSKDEVPEMVVVCVGGKLHVYSRETEPSKTGH